VASGGDVYKGDFGRLRVGGQGSYTERQVFAGIGGGPNTNESIFLTSLRYSRSRLKIGLSAGGHQTPLATSYFSAVRELIANMLPDRARDAD